MQTTLLDAIFGVAVLILTSSGLVVIFGLMKVVNFAHGEAMMLGAYVALLSQSWGSFPLSVFAAAIFVGVLGLVVERLMVRRLYRRVLDTILATWGLGLLIRELVRAIQGTSYNSLPPPVDGPIEILGTEYSQYRLIIVTVAAALLLALFLIDRFTPLGRLVRAVMANPDLAASLGVNVDRVYLASFGTGWLLAGMAGALLAPLVTITPQMGSTFLIGGFLTTILAGASLLGIGPAAGLLGSTSGIVSTYFDATTASIATLIITVIVMRIRNLRRRG